MSTASNDVPANQARDSCVQEAIRGGFIAGITALAAAGLSVGLANHFWPAFRSSLGVSGKTALIVSIGLTTLFK